MAGHTDEAAAPRDQREELEEPRLLCQGVSEPPKRHQVAFSWTWVQNCSSLLRHDIAQASFPFQLQKSLNSSE